VKDKLGRDEAATEVKSVEQYVEELDALTKKHGCEVRGEKLYVWAVWQRARAIWKEKTNSTHRGF